MKSFQMPILSMSLLGLCLLSGLDTPTARAGFRFGEPTNLGPPVNSGYHDYEAYLSPDGLELYFCSNRPGGYGGYDIWVTKRARLEDPWGPPANLGPQINTSDWDAPGSMSADGLVLYMQLSGQDIYTTTRATRDAPWGPRVNLGPIVNTSYVAAVPVVSADGLELYFASNRSGGYGNWDIWLSTRATISDPWGASVNLSATINTPYIDVCTWISPDGLTLLFFSDRPGGFGAVDAWMTTRASKSSPWGPARNLGPSINTSYSEWVTATSPDGRSCYFCDFGLLIYNPRPGGLGGADIWQAPISPVVDFNGDGIVDAADVVIMIEHWLTDYPLCDIGPMPWGDGIVDVQDLIVLAEHLFEDYRLIAHWKLDEEQGSTAYDSAGKYDADLHGGPVWQPSGGKEGGTLQFDGTNDYVSTPLILNPAKGSFSVSAWIKGGAPGQVMISQRDVGRDPGNTWLLADASYGRLMTRLMHPPFPPLVSESVITDGQWHHVGLVYDFIGLHRYLYVDGTEVAKDSDFVAGVGSDGGLYIGADKTLNAGTFFSGLIDDVRIYNQPLSPEEVAALAR